MRYYDKNNLFATLSTRISRAVEFELLSLRQLFLIGDWWLLIVLWRAKPARSYTQHEVSAERWFSVEPASQTLEPILGEWCSRVGWHCTAHKDRFLTFVAAVALMGVFIRSRRLLVTSLNLLLFCWIVYIVGKTRIVDYHCKTYFLVKFLLQSKKYMMFFWEECWWTKIGGIEIEEPQYTSV